MPAGSRRWQLLDGDVTSDPHVVVDGALAVSRPEPDRASTVAADETTVRRWHERLQAVRTATDRGGPQ